MTHTQSDLQLDFIQKVSLLLPKDFEANKKTTECLHILAQLFNSPLITLSFVFHDQYNEEHLFNSYIYSHAQHKIFAKKYKFQSNTLSLMFAELIKKQNEYELTLDQFIENIFSNENNLKELTESKENIKVFPFISSKKLKGFISYQASSSKNIKVKYPAIYEILKIIFKNEYEKKESDININTLQTVLNLMPQRVFWKNKTSTYLGCNKAFSDDASLDYPEKIIGLTDHDIFPDQAELYRSDDRNTMLTRTHLINSEEPQTHQNGNTIWLRTSKRPIISEDDNVIGVVGTYDDITLLKRTQEQLSDAKNDLEMRVVERTKALTDSKSKLEVLLLELKSTQEQLVENEKMAALGALVAGVAHEINTPIGVAVTGASNLERIALELVSNLNSGKLSKSRFTEDCKQLAQSGEIVLRNLERASLLIQNFKLIAVDQSNDENRKINIHNYLADVIGAMSPITNKKNIKFFLTGDELITINTYPGAIAQIITNLINNAMDHAFTDEQNAEIKISFSIKANKLTLNFEDNGKGISQKSVSKIFEPFYTTNRRNGGTGLGLSIVYNLVTQKLNGSIECKSKESQWTRFSIEIPC